MSQDVRDVIVIGSGVGGLTAGALLAHEGLDVLVIEQNEWIGGCCSSRTEDGFTFDEGAVFILNPEIYEFLFQLLDRELQDYLDLALLDPAYQTILGDGSQLLIPRDPEKMAEIIREVSPGDIDGWWRFVRDMKRAWDAAMVMFKTPPPSLSMLGTPRHLLSVAMRTGAHKGAFLLFRNLLRSHASVIDSYFENPLIKLIMSFETLYAGLPAYRASGLFSPMPMLRHFGIWYPKGGMGAIPGALRKVLEEHDGSVMTGRKATRILTRDKVAVGVELEDGEKISSRFVLSNVNATTTYLDLVGRENLGRRFTRTIEGYRLSICAPMLRLGLKGNPPMKAHMMVIGISRDQPLNQFNEYWDEVYPKGHLIRAEDLPLLITSPSFTDPSLAPPGGCSLTVMTGLPYRLRYHRWDEIRDEYIDDIIRVLERRWAPGLSNQVVHKSLMSPPDMERTYSLPDGAIYGFELSLPNMGPFRPSWRSPVIDNLYLAGACTNPGGGVPLVMHSGMMSAAALARQARG